MVLNHSNEFITRTMEPIRIKGKNWNRVDIEEAIQQAENQVWIGKVANFTIDIAPKPFNVWGDMVNFRQVFANLLDNCKAALEGVENPEVSIKCRFLNEGKLATMEVSDNGCGISDEIKELVWKTLLTTSETGTGLGLCNRPRGH
jgi:C4-dicarboxylate-specific signal transduction histidine kinase